MAPKPTKQQLEGIIKELLHRKLCLEDLDYWADHAIKGFTGPGRETFRPAKHHRLLLNYLKRVEKREIDRLMVFMPPGAAKSTYTGPIFTSWMMARHARSEIISTSAASNLASTLSRKTQALIRLHAKELDIKPLQDNAEYWSTSNGSTYLAASVGQNITGFRASAIICDDPVKNFEDANSETIRESTWNWFNTVLMTRLIPDSPVIVIQTRWHVDDLSGRLLETQGRKEDGGLWTVLSLPAVWEGDEPDELGRNRGDLLWPEWQHGNFIEGKKKELGIRDFASLFQQSPRPSEGSLFKTQMFRFEQETPKGGSFIRAWDLAATKKEGSRNPDYTVGVLMQKRPDDTVCVCDVVRFRDGPEKVRETIMNTAQRDGTSVKISLPQDPGAAGKYVVADLTKMLMGYNVEASPESGAKETRAMPYVAQVNAGNVTLLKRSWNDEYLDELQGFPGLLHDDQVDASSRAFAGLINPGMAPRMVEDYNFMAKADEDYFDYGGFMSR